MLRDDIRLTCPHGRPLMIELSRADIEKRFKRIQERGES
jgi:DNA mismatch repair ATPase MutL